VHNAPTVGKLNFIQLNLATKNPSWLFLNLITFGNFWVMCLDHFFFFTSSGTLGTSINLIATKRIAHLSSRMAIHLSMDFGVNSHTNGENGALKLQRTTHTNKKSRVYLIIF
jgi:hypothetical protein